MSGECERCGEHCLDCICSSNKQYKDTVAISIQHLLDLIYWARRYCDGRATYAPTEFNRIYNNIRSAHPDLIRCKDQFDETLMEKGKYWPYAQDGQYNEKTDRFDARPLKPRSKDPNDWQNKFHECISHFKVTIIPIHETRTHYHFKRRKDMKEAMRMNFNSYDTFSYASKQWAKIIPTKDMLKDASDGD